MKKFNYLLIAAILIFVSACSGGGGGGDGTISADTTESSGAGSGSASDSAPGSGSGGGTSSGMTEAEKDLVASFLGALSNHAEAIKNGRVGRSVSSPISTSIGSCPNVIAMGRNHFRHIFKECPESNPAGGEFIMSGLIDFITVETDLGGGYKQADTTTVHPPPDNSAPDLIMGMSVVFNGVVMPSNRAGYGNWEFHGSMIENMDTFTTTVFYDKLFDDIPMELISTKSDITNYQTLGTGGSEDGTMVAKNDSGGFTITRYELTYTNSSEWSEGGGTTANPGQCSGFMTWQSMDTGAAGRCNFSSCDVCL